MEVRDLQQLKVNILHQETTCISEGELGREAYKLMRWEPAGLLWFGVS